MSKAGSLAKGPVAAAWPGVLQGCGCLVAGDIHFSRILFASANLGDVFPVSANAAIGADTLTLFDRHELHRIRNVLGHTTISEHRAFVFLKVLGGVEYQVMLHRAGECAVVELLPETLPVDQRMRVAEKARAVLEMPLPPGGLDAFLDEATEFLRSMVGFDQVVFHKFLPDGAGEVVAEARHPDRPALLGQRVPADDLGDAARLARMSPSVRVIADTTAPGMDLLGQAGDGGLELSLALLRGGEAGLWRALKQLGARSALHLPVPVEGAPWGLFACYHPEPVTLSPSALDALDLALGLISLRVQNALDVSRHADQARDLNLRVRNILTLVQSMSLHSRQNAQSVAVQAGGLERRILALLDTECTPVGSTAPGVPLEKILHTELDPRDTGQHRMRIGGPKVSVAFEAAATLAVVFHELAANAVTFGALSVPNGAVTIRWLVDEEGLRLSWHELGGDGPNDDPKTDFSLAIIREAVPYETGGRATLDLRDDGLEATLLIPARFVVGAAEPAPTLIREDLEGQAATLPGLGRALVVEDSYVIAKMEARLLIEAGFAAVDTAAGVSEARACLDKHAYEFCLLDINLGGSDGTAVADALEHRKIPFAFATGYADEARELIAGHDAPVIGKPIDAQTLSNVLATLITNRE